MYDFCSLYCNPDLLLALLTKPQTTNIGQFLGMHLVHKECFNVLGHTVCLKLNNP